eukprot:scaffold2510_cov169-Amphora_coffeaeformis.AAC.6
MPAHHRLVVVAPAGLEAIFVHRFRRDRSAWPEKSFESVDSWDHSPCPQSRTNFRNWPRHNDPLDKFETIPRQLSNRDVSLWTGMMLHFDARDWNKSPFVPIPSWRHPPTGIPFDLWPNAQMFLNVAQSISIPTGSCDGYCCWIFV